jgi:ribosomal-protein-alanine N-acetyltransferase
VAGGRIAGYIVTCVEGPDAEMISIAVDPRARRRGIGASLVEHTIHRLAGVRRLNLMVRTGNAAALRFYHKLGFRKIGRAARYYENREDAFRMRKRLG